MAKHKYIPCDIYKRGITVFIGNKEEFIKYCEQTYNEDEEDEAFIYSIKTCSYGYADFHFGNGYGIVRIPDFPQKPIEIAATAHELLHATQWMLWYCGVEYENKNCTNEAYTYLHEHLVRNAFEEDGYKEFNVKEENYENKT